MATKNTIFSREVYSLKHVTKEDKTYFILNCHQTNSPDMETYFLSEELFNKLQACIDSLETVFLYVNYNYKTKNWNVVDVDTNII